MNRPAEKPGTVDAQRRARRGSPTLTRERVVKAALAMVDGAGPDAVSMRALADVLGVTPMALYNHVSNKRDLLRAVAEHVLAETIFDHGLADWRGQVEACFHTLRKTCLRHPGAARLLEIEGVAPVAAFAPMEVTVNALTGAGLGPDDALRAYFTLLSFTLGQASYQTRGPMPDLDPGAAVRAGRIGGRLARKVSEADLGDWDFDRAFEFGMRLILDGIEASLHRN